ncbi:zinc finger, CCHC-type containing protein, partial [Tanacetum coccineum]
AATAMKHIASNFAKLDKFEGVDFRRWQKKMYFLLSSMSVVYVLTTPIPEDGDDASVEQLRKRNKWDNDDYVCRGLIPKVMEQYNELLGILGRFTQHKMNMDEAIQISCIIDKLPSSWKDFKHTLKHKKEELTLIELGSHLRIEESLMAQDSDKLKGNNVVGPHDSILWHARLGHVHFKRMQDMSKDGLISAFDMDTEKCKTCMLAKIAMKAFQNIKHETKVLELIHSDLCDLHATPLLGNKKYFVTFIDDASRTDRGGKYMDTLYFQSVGIIHKTSAPYTPQQNGISERKNIVMKEMDNSTLSYSGLSQRAVVRLPDPKLKTLGERGIECIFVGYAEYSKAFRFFIIEPNDSVVINSIIESSDAIFDENRFSSVPRPSLKIPNGTEYIGGSVVPEEVTEEEKRMKSLTNTPIDIYWLSFSVVGKLSKYTSNPVLEGYTDASRISNSEDNLSTSGWVFLLGGGAISWASKKQTCITGSTMESEFMALAAASKEAEWLENLLLEIPLWSKPIAPISIRCDSVATLAKAYIQMYNGMSRHLGIRHSMIRELITNGVISIEFVRSQQNLFDHLTKELARDLVIKSVLDHTEISTKDKHDDDTDSQKNQEVDACT